jgi:hypothetical protein
MAPDSPGSGSLSPLEIEPGSEESPSESTGGEKSWISMILMKIRNPCVSHLEWIILTTGGRGVAAARRKALAAQG